MSGVDAHTPDVVRVKPLEWEERTHIPPVLDVIGWAARDCFGEYYEISIEPDGLWLDHECLISGVLSDTLEAAKEAAQADYERRILSAIEPSAAYTAMCRAFLIALVDPAHPDLDYLRAALPPRVQQ